MPVDNEFAALLVEQLNDLGAKILKQHDETVESLRRELEVAKSGLEDKDHPMAWSVPADPAPRPHLGLKGGPSMAPSHLPPQPHTHEALPPPKQEMAVQASQPPMVSHSPRLGGAGAKTQRKPSRSHTMLKSADPTAATIGKCGSRSPSPAGTPRVVSGELGCDAKRPGSSSYALGESSIQTAKNSRKNSPASPSSRPDRNNLPAFSAPAIVANVPHSNGASRSNSKSLKVQDASEPTPSESSSGEEETSGARHKPRDFWTWRVEVQRVPGRRNSSFHQNLAAEWEARDARKKEPKMESDSMCVQMVMMHPASKRRLTWTLLSVLLLLYDIIFIPINVFFGLPENSFFTDMETFSLVFWMCDLPMSFMTGQRADGSLEMRPWGVAKIYCSSWFVLDLSLILSEWFAIILQVGGGVSAISLLRATRVLRLLQLLRIARLSKLAGDLALFLPDPVIMFFGLLKALFTFSALVHVLACFWYGIGSQDDSESSLGWVRQSGLAGHSTAYCYVFSMMWVIMQFHGVAPIQVGTALEALFVGFCGAFGFIIVAVAVIKLSSALESTEEKHRAQMHRLCRQYVRGRHVSSELALRLRRHLGEGCGSGGNRRTSLRDRVEHEELMVKELPSFLQMDLYEEVRRPLLERHRLFHDLRLTDGTTAVLRELCTEAMKCEAALFGELIFGRGELCSVARMVETGVMNYLTKAQSNMSATTHSISIDSESKKAGNFGSLPLRERSDPLSEEDKNNTNNVVVTASMVNQQVAKPEKSASRLARGLSVFSRRAKSTEKSTSFAVRREEQGMISEAVLWASRWEHCGVLGADKDSTLIALDAAKFTQVIGNHDQHRTMAVRYASNFMHWVNSADEQEAFTDLMRVPANIVTEHHGMSNVCYKDHLIFISHFKREAGTEATLLQEGVIRLLHEDPLSPVNDMKTPVFLDSNNLDDLATLEKHVKRAHNLVLLLTPGIFTRPWCLLEILTAIKYDVAIVPVEIQRSGTTFKLPDDRYFDKLCSGELLEAQDVQLLRSKSVDLNQLRDIQNVFQKIMIPFSPQKSGAIRDAELMDILRRCPIRARQHSRQHSP